MFKSKKDITSHVQAPMLTNKIQNCQCLLGESQSCLWPWFTICVQFFNCPKVTIIFFNFCVLVNNTTSQINVQIISLVSCARIRTRDLEYSATISKSDDCSCQNSWGICFLLLHWTCLRMHLRTVTFFVRGSITVSAGLLFSFFRFSCFASC